MYSKLISQEDESCDLLKELNEFALHIEARHLASLEYNRKMYLSISRMHLWENTEEITANPKKYSIIIDKEVI